MKECTQWMTLGGTGMKSERKDEHKLVFVRWKGICQSNLEL